MKEKEHFVFGYHNKQKLVLIIKMKKVRQEASDLVSLMTPVVKTMFTDMGMEITSEAMQVHGGYGLH